MRVANCIHGYTVLSPKELASVPIVAETFGGNMSLSGIESWWQCQLPVTSLVLLAQSVDDRLQIHNSCRFRQQSSSLRKHLDIDLHCGFNYGQYLKSCAHCFHIMKIILVIYGFLYDCLFFETTVLSVIVYNCSAEIYLITLIMLHATDVIISIRNLFFKLPFLCMA